MAIPGVMAHSVSRRMSKNRGSAGSGAIAGSSGSSIINSAALQADLARQFNLNAVTRSHRRGRAPTGPAAFGGANATGGGGGGGGEAARDAWSCSSCTLVNACGTSRCEACGAPYARNDNTGEMPAEHGRLSLAQLRGLAPLPPKKLTEEEWVGVETEALLRGDVTGCCSICMEELGTSDQVILSCSHTFHAACIASFERFLRTKARTCPMCRHASYQKKVTSVGVITKRQECAMAAQATVRMYLAKVELKRRRKQLYATGQGDKSRRHDFFASEISNIGDRALEEVQRGADSVDLLFAEFNQNLALSRQVFDSSVSTPGVGNTGINLIPPPNSLKTATSKLSMPQWVMVYERSKSRGSSECPICMNDCEDGGDDVLLSCSHTFHKKCIEAFERFNIYEVCLCPVCRDDYTKINVFNVKQMALGDGRFFVD
ncbi:hypothetical protein TrVE_jg11599 [Triparma verrucosa]|uniref:RanBP-type and C3HC4-type zinc finger-containing protein 1 n=1 Tax=Triparma verrucosa TaxID=1606542 RepID=A0A9W7BID4_9STRA|nr:hypothetical protein TrVE_jg11599 [Triparma verrucosa]